MASNDGDIERRKKIKTMKEESARIDSKKTILVTKEYSKTSKHLGKQQHATVTKNNLVTAAKACSKTNKHFGQQQQATLTTNNFSNSSDSVQQDQQTFWAATACDGNKEQF